MAYLSSSVRAAGCDERALAASRHTHNGNVDIVGPVVPIQSQQRSRFTGPCCQGMDTYLKRISFIISL